MSINNLPKRLVQVRKDKGYTRKELSSLLGIPYRTLTNYENGEREPGHSFIIRMAKEFNVSTDYLLGISDTPSRTGNPPDNKKKSAEPKEDTAENVCKRYKALDSHGKQVVCAVMTEEERRIKAVAKEPVVIELFPMRHYIQSASAGLGDFADDDSFEIIDLVKRPPAGASFLVTVNGDSMEPTYHDGQWVFIRAQETLQYGEIGLFAIGADLYIKEYGVNGLISHNPAYAVRQPPADTPARIYGKVLGVCSSDYFR